MSWSNQPALLTKVTFGKHRGSHWIDVPDGYLDWIISTAIGFDENVIHTAKSVRASRREANCIAVRVLDGDRTGRQQDGQWCS
jgi:hypothetical protein